MEIAYYNLSGGINQALTKTELGLDTKKIYWADAENIEVLRNRGIKKQLGNALLCELPVPEKITGLFEMVYRDDSKLVITTVSGKIYIFNPVTGVIKELEKTLTGVKPYFAGFLNGVLIITESDGLFYIKNNDEYEVLEADLKDAKGNPVTGDVLAVYKGRVWVSSKSTIYYSALGSYTDFTAEDDAGYISDFHTDTSEITALKPYKDYLAIYKKSMVYLLTGTSAKDFAIVPFVDKGSVAAKSVVNVENRQYFLSTGIFALEQVGELNQMQLGSEISLSIKPEFDKFYKPALSDAICIHYENKNQMWFFIPYISDDFFHTIWINDYVNKAWYKRVIPQNVTTAGLFNGYVITGDSIGRIYKEDFGLTFDGQPIAFMWKSPFLATGSAHHRKIIDEFYFVLEDEFDNSFDFSIYKDYDSMYSDDIEKIYLIHHEHFVWGCDETDETPSNCWATENWDMPVWPVSKNILEKAEISEANYAIQLCVSGTEKDHNCAIIGLQFREIYNDD